MNIYAENDFSIVHALIKNGELEKALSKIINAKNGRINSEFLVDLNHAWYCVADCKFRLNDVFGAVSAFKKAYAANPQDIESLLAIANCYDALGRPKMSERFLRKAILLNPKGRNLAAVLVNLGNALMDQRRWLEAIDCFNIPSKRRDAIGSIARKNQALAIKSYKE